MNCDRCQQLISDFLDGTLNPADRRDLSMHLTECFDCESVRQDLSNIIGFCSAHRGEYEPVPNQKAMWLRIRNVVEDSFAIPRLSTLLRKTAGAAALVEAMKPYSRHGVNVNVIAPGLVVSLYVLQLGFMDYGHRPVAPPTQAWAMFAQSAMVIDLGKSQILKRQMTQACHGVVGREFPPPNFFE